MSKTLLAVMLLFGAALCGAEIANAQEGPGGAINPNRDCQTLLTCNFKKGGSWRGCVSSYSCRSCRFVPVPCSSIGGKRKRVCRQLECDWNGT
jgi:hypothetical protein